MRDARDNLIKLWKTGVAVVRGDTSVAADLEDNPIAPPDQILAIGKAAGAMASAALARFPGTPCLIVTKYGHAADGINSAQIIESAHPVPDDNSLRAGSALLAAVQNCPTGSHLLMLVSGGASALAEALPDGMDLADLATETQRLLASGADIHAMNARRKDLSRIKGGKLLSHFQGAKVTSLAISDVEGDALSVIGSGIGGAPESRGFAFDQRIVASNATARAAIAAAAEIEVIRNEETLYDDVGALAARLGACLRDGQPGLYIWGGEPTVVLPDTPGQGGRNMALGLSLAREIKGHPIDILVAGTDGTDGPTDAAGALINGETWQPQAQHALDTADAYPWLQSHDALFKSGPTGTNVMDILIARKH